MKINYLICLCFFVVSCARVKLTQPKDAMRPAHSLPHMSDSYPRNDFFVTLKKHIEVMKNSHQINDPMIFGKREISKDKYISALEELLSQEQNADWIHWIENHFELYEVYGRDHWGEVMSTGYYEPHVIGSHEKNSEFSQAIYSTPDDLIIGNLKQFKNDNKRKDYPDQIVGRLKNKVLVPYYDRKDIDVLHVLEGKNLELAWLRPIDAFFMQIQGSGLIEFLDGSKMRIGFANQNGHTYRAIGKSLTHIIPKEEMSLQKIQAYLKTLPRQKQQDILNLNPSYVFFKKLDGQSLTFAGMEVSEGRTIATDKTFFPKGALAFLDIEEPVFENSDLDTPSSWKRMPRFVFDQDTGGAIIGGDRVDLFFGKGNEAAQKAGVMKQMGRLYYLVPKF